MRPFLQALPRECCRRHPGPHSESAAGLVASVLALAEGGGYKSSNFFWNASPTLSVTMASAVLGSVTTSKIPAFVSWFARY